MSDTTITPEDRGEIVGYVKRAKRDAFFSLSADGFAVVVDALEQAEVHAEKAEAQVARLTKERDWLAEKLANIADKMNGMDAPKSFCAACNICPVGDHEMEGETCLEQICKAARKAVADAESEVDA